MNAGDSQRLFPPFRLDPLNAQLWRGQEEITLRPKTFDVLRFLVEHPGQLVTKAMLLDAVWPDVSVSDSMPATCVAELRRALDDDAKAPKFIETVHRRGYRFIAALTDGQSIAASPKPETKSRQLEPAKLPTPVMVGRQEELAQLQRWYSRVAQGERLVVFVAGEAGIGKTTFVQAFLDSIAQPGNTRIGRGQCTEQYGAGEPYMPVLEAFSRLGRARGGEQIIELLNRFAPTWLAQMPELMTREERVRLQGETQGITQQRMLREMTQALEALAAESPLVLLLEDLHWSDFSTLALISAIARRSEPARLMLVGTYRPVELAKDHPLRTMKQELVLHQQCEELRLKLLGESDIQDYLAKRLASDGSRQFGTLAPVIHVRTDGNPLFMVNMVEYLLLDAGLLVNSREMTEGEWAETLRAHRLDALHSVREMIERNLERLRPDEQAVLEGASVAGPEFSAASVAAALERPQDEIEACCINLSRREQFVSAQGPVSWPDGTIATGFRFQHALYQEVLYSRLPAGRQVQLHQRIAMREEAGYGESVNEVATELAHHYNRANDKHKAIQYFWLAGERAFARGAMVEAEKHYRRAVKLLAELPQTAERDQRELELMLALGGVLWISKSWSHSETASVYAQAQKLAETLGETAQLVSVLKGLAVSALGRGQNKLALDMATQMLMAAERGGDRASLLAAHSLIGQSLLWLAQYTEARKHFELGSRYYDEGDPSSNALFGIDAPALEAIAVLLLGFADAARQLMKEASRRSEGPKDLFRVGLVHMWGATLSWFLGDGSATLEHAQELRRLTAKQPVWTGLADVHTGRALMLQGDWEGGIRYVRESSAFNKAMGLTAQLTITKLSEAEFFGHEERIDDALGLIAAVLADSEDLAHIQPICLCQRANLLSFGNADPSVIEVSYRSAIESAHNQGARYLELQATTSFARWLRSQGRSAEARRMLAGVYNWFTEGFDTVALREAKRLLDELSLK
jgi:DNA-binding winged helix-turn-helix (wHTH) protein/tetratricopeptide (TPR) repeat protein